MRAIGTTLQLFSGLLHSSRVNSSPSNSNHAARTRDGRVRRTSSLALISPLLVGLSGFAGLAAGDTAFASWLPRSSPGVGTGAFLSSSLSALPEAATAALLSSVSCEKAAVTGAANLACKVTLSAAAPSGGLLVSLQSSSASALLPSKVKVAAGASTVTFTTKALTVTTSQAAVLTAQSSGATTVFSLALNAVTPHLDVSSQVVDFGSSMIGSSATTQRVTLSSTGTAPLTISAVTLTGSAYSISSAAFPLTLSPGSKTTVALQFSPKAVGSPTGQIAIQSNSSGSPVTLVGLTASVTPFLADLNGFFCANSTIIGMASDSCVVVLTGAAPDTGITVALSTNNSALTIPTTVTVPSGKSGVSFLASRTAAGTSSAATLKVTHGSVARSASLTLVASSPAFSLPGGSYSNAVMLSMLESTPGTTIHYTTDGSAPSASAAVYSSPLTVAANQTVQAIALSDTSATSAPTVAKYKITSVAAPLPAGSSFIVPQSDTCQSPYDQFYGSEPGVYAFWPMCESGSNIDIFDYVGNWGLSENHTSGQVLAWGSGNVAGGLPGPVADGETAAQVATTSISRTNLGIPLNANQGTVAIWMQAQPSPSLEQALLFYTSGKSWIGLGLKTNGTTCFVGSFVDATGTASAATQCGFAAESWNRVVMTWGGGVISLYVNGALANTSSYATNIDNKVFNYRLFPACCGYAKTMTLAKGLVANQAWSAQQVAADFAPILASPPTGGVYVTTNQLGVIHRDVLGFADDNSDLSNATQIATAKTGLAAAGVTAVRYANGAGGITADLENWQGGAACTGTAGVTQAALNTRTGDAIGTYIPEIAQPLGLDIGFTVNYGTNAPYCDAGGDPVANAGALANFTNVTHQYGVKYWEIGNEVWSSNTEPDFHANAHTGASYIANEPSFYDAIKGQDANSQVAIPLAGADYNKQMNFDLPVLAGAKYDAVVFHNYPIKAPVSDGATLYRDRVATDLLRTRGELLTLQTELLSNSKPGDAIWITEWDADLDGDKWTKQSMGAVMPLFAAGELGEYMRAGVKYATWWAQSAIDVCSNSNYDTSGDSSYSWWPCGSAGLVYNGPNPGYGHEVLVGLKTGDLMPAARAFQVLSQSGFVVEGEHMLSTIADAPDTPWLQEYAATHGGSYAVMLINRDRDSSHVVPLSFAGMSSGSVVTQWSYGRAQYDLSQAGDWSAAPTQATFGSWSGTFNATLPPWSVSVLVFTR